MSDVVFEINKMRNGWFLFYASTAYPRSWGPYKTKREARAKMDKLRKLSWYAHTRLINKAGDFCD